MYMKRIDQTFASDWKQVPRRSKSLLHYVDRMQLVSHFTRFCYVLVFVFISSGIEWDQTSDHAPPGVTQRKILTSYHPLWRYAWYTMLCYTPIFFLNWSLNYRSKIDRKVSFVTLPSWFFFFISKTSMFYIFCLVFHTFDPTCMAISNGRSNCHWTQYCWRPSTLPPQRMQHPTDCLHLHCVCCHSWQAAVAHHIKKLSDGKNRHGSTTRNGGPMAQMLV